MLKFFRGIHSCRPSEAARATGGPRAPFNTQFKGQRSNFDRNMPFRRPQKAWEKDGEAKDVWFRKKHAKDHAYQKSRGTTKQYRAPREYHDRQVLHKLTLDPLVDYVYGLNPVLAALQSGKRGSFGRLHTYNLGNKSQEEKLKRVAEANGITLVESTKQDLNQMTNNGVHNGIVLETRPLDVESVTSLGKSQKGSLLIGDNYTETIDPTRYPLGVYLDGISDPHNVGAILRSAFFLGADFVVLSGRNCASLTPLVSKTSAGAMEFLPIYTCEKPLQFFDDSASNGWSIVSTVTPETTMKYPAKAIQAEALAPLVHESPLLLVIGSEGNGIRTNLLNKSQYVVTLDSTRDTGAVDSLNVSVATALLLDKATAPVEEPEQEEEEMVTIE